MSYEDPFSSAPAEEAQAVPAEQAPVATATVASTPVLANSASGDLSVTFKGDGSFAYPWIVPKYGSVPEALIDLGADPSDVAAMNQAQLWATLFQRTKLMNDSFAKLGGATTTAPQNAGQAPQQQASRAPAGASQAPNGETRTCSHGPMVFKSGVSKAGNAYKLFSCTAPRDSQCKAEYLR